ncbi:MAG: (Fe-S)-binding protein [Deltaproteobacteria bacterium]|nr:(Fe-S)-binding protein [Deltaproteobacteria bacterium]
MVDIKMEEHYGNEDELGGEILNIVSKCVKCRFCFSQCPVYEVSNGWVTQGASGITQALYYGIKFNCIDKALRDILMRCTTCRSCEIICERLMAGVTLVDAIKKGRQLLMEAGIDPIREQQKVLESLQTLGNPYGKQPLKRTTWAEGLDLKRLDLAPDDVSVLYYVGCTPSYDDRVQNVARSIAGILKKVGVAFGILEMEKSSGDTALVMGERGLFEDLAKKNMISFEKSGIQTILTTSPHDFNSFLKNYPEDIRKINIAHYTQFVAGLVDKGRLSFKQELNRKVTYHDPCYLGKHNGIYDEPRKLLKAIPGLELVEMERTRESSLCCGGGGGRMWVDFDEATHLAEVRVREAMDTGAQILATACPFCLIQFEDAVKTLDREDTFVVRDVSELLFEAMGPEL